MHACYPHILGQEITINNTLQNYFTTLQLHLTYLPMNPPKHVTGSCRSKETLQHSVSVGPRLYIAQYPTYFKLPTSLTQLHVTRYHPLLSLKRNGTESFAQTYIYIYIYTHTKNRFIYYSNK